MGDLVIADRSHDQPVVFVIDDDASMREGLSSLLRSIGLTVEVLSSATEFSPEKIPDAPCCMVLDVRMPGISGLDFQTHLEKIGISIPIVFMTGYGDIPMSVKAMKAGAIEFLTKPFRDQDIVDAVRIAIERNRERRHQDRLLSKLRASYKLLTPREKEVIVLVASGMMNKQIAAQLDISEITVKVHRGNVMRKMGAHSLADLVRMTDALGIHRGTA